jgi:hypothetical protein
MGQKAKSLELDFNSLSEYIKLLRESSTANYSKEDLKDSIFEFLNQCIDNENLD